MLLEALEAEGIEASLVAWDDPKVDWSIFELAVIRSTWDYPERPTAFQHWVERTASMTELLNPGRIVSGNIHKSYLERMQARGVDIVPTSWFEQGWRGGLGSVPWDQIVVKPCISAGSMLTEKFDGEQRHAAIQFLHEQCQHRDMMVQPYLKSVENGGEIAWIWIDGEVTHGVRKAPRFADGIESVSDMIKPDAIVVERIEHILGSDAHQLLYARVDMMLDDEGKWLLSELELIEPSLFLRQNPLALSRLVKGIGIRLKRKVASR
jgi:hypothetical protein